VARGKNSLYPLDMRLGGPQNRSERGGEEKNSQPPPGIEQQNTDRPARNSALYRLSYDGSVNRKESLNDLIWCVFNRKRPPQFDLICTPFF
jgi:hypothetical protein